MNGRRQPICEGIVLVLPSGIWLTCTSKIFSLVPPDHLRLQGSLTPPTCSLAPPSASLAPPLFSHLRLPTFPLLLLIENVCTLSFHNAMILNLACYLNFIPPCPPQWHHLNPNSLFKLSPPCLPQCYHLKSNSLFKLYPPCLPPCHHLNSNSLFKLPPPCLPQCHELKYASLFKLPPPAFHNAMN